jgi:hypothetical protein
MIFVRSFMPNGMHRSTFNPIFHMLSKFRYFGAVLLVLSLRSTILAQAGYDPDAVAAALGQRKVMTGNIVSGSEAPAAAVDRLKGMSSPTGLKIDHEADFAFAAMDVGQRLIAADKTDAAALFFQAAEKSLVVLVNRTPEAQAPAKAHFLENLSFIRGNCLNEVAQARLDIEQAIALRPDDPHLQDMRRNLARDHAEFFKNPTAK